MKLGMDLCSFSSVHQGGKDEVAYNLLRGFETLGYTKDIVCFCSTDLVDVIRNISENVTIYTISTKQCHSLLRYWERIREGRAVRKLVSVSGIDGLLFTNKESPLVKFPIPTFVIPHDIQLFRLDYSWLQKPRAKYRNWAARNLMHREFQLRDHIFAISDFDKGEMGSFIPEAADKIKRIYDPIRFVPSVASGGEKKYITALNIQWDHKNIETLVYAYAKIADQLPWDLILVGKRPWQQEKLEQHIRECGVESRVHFTGFVSEAELQRIISETRIYVNPSTYEGFGMTAVEMMGQRIPTIVAANTAQPEVTRGLCRYYAPTKDADALAAQILEELHNPTSKEALEDIAKQVREAYDYINISREYWSFLEATVKR